MNILFETKFGSHIYGTSTPQSDIDYKGIYQATYEDIILNRVKESIVTTTKKDKREGVRNSAGDIDREYKELRRFIFDCISGQTYAFDMLYTPEEFWISTSKIWLDIQQEKHRFLSKQMNAFLGYVRQQTGKYAMKGTRLAAVVSTIDFLKTVNPDLFLNEVWDDIPKSDFCSLIEYETLVNKELGREVMLTVLEKKFQGRVKVKFVLDNLEKFYTEFGGRSQMAMENQGVDWKAISHAYRACYQILNIAQEGKIIFPLREAEYVKQVKLGTISWKDKIQEELPLLMSNAIETLEKSNLPDTVDKTFWDNFIIETYRQ